MSLSKDHERIRQTREVIVDYRLSITSALSKRDTVLKRENNKQKLMSVLSIFSLGENLKMETRYNGVVGHNEADITRIYVTEAVNYGERVIRVLSDDTDDFVLLVCWV